MLKVEKGSAPPQLFNAEEHVDIGRLFTVWSRLYLQAEAVKEVLGRM